MTVSTQKAHFCVGLLVFVAQKGLCWRNWEWTAIPFWNWGIELECNSFFQFGIGNVLHSFFRGIAKGLDSSKPVGEKPWLRWRKKPSARPTSFKDHGWILTLCFVREAVLIMNNIGPATDSVKSLNPVTLLNGTQISCHDQAHGNPLTHRRTCYTQVYLSAHQMFDLLMWKNEVLAMLVTGERTCWRAWITFTRKASTAFRPMSSLRRKCWKNDRRQVLPLFLSRRPHQEVLLLATGVEIWKASR